MAVGLGFLLVFAILLAFLLRAPGGIGPLGAKTPERSHASIQKRRTPLRQRPHAVSDLAARYPKGTTLRGRAWVIDGDTIAINRTKIRLAGIDAPELDMPWGQKSKWTMVEICKGRQITAVSHGEVSYDRIVATCYRSDGVDIGAEIVKCGLALDLTGFSGGKYRHYEPDGARRKLANGRFGHRSKLDTPLGQRLASRRTNGPFTPR